jgi:hypothetical protein
VFIFKYSLKKAKPDKTNGKNRQRGVSDTDLFNNSVVESSTLFDGDLQFWFAVVISIAFMCSPYG